MSRYWTRLLHEVVMALSVILSGGPDATDAFETIRQHADELLCCQVRRQRQM